MKSDNQFESCLGIFVSVSALLVLSSVLNGWALSSVWNWFIPTIFGLPVLTLWQAVGVGMVLQLFVHNVNYDSNKDTKGKTYWEVFFTSLIEIIVRNVMYFGMGWIIFQLAF